MLLWRRGGSRRFGLQRWRWRCGCSCWRTGGCIGGTGCCRRRHCWRCCPRCPSRGRGRRRCSCFLSSLPAAAVFLGLSWSLVGWCLVLGRVERESVVLPVTLVGQAGVLCSIQRTSSSWTLVLLDVWWSSRGEATLVYAGTMFACTTAPSQHPKHTESRLPCVNCSNRFWAFE